MEEIFKLFYNSLEKPIDIKGILLFPYIEDDKIVWRYDNPADLSFNSYVLETCIEDLFYDFCKQAEMTLVPTFPIFWDIDSPKTLYINEELKSKIEQSLLEIKDLSYWDDNNSNLVCKSQMDYWELSQEFSETIFLEVGFNIYDILIDEVPVDSIKANKWLEGYMHAEDANVEAQYLLDETSCIIFEEETVADESYMNIAVSIYETCIEDNPTPTSVAFIAKEEEVSDDYKVEIVKTYHENGQIKEEIEAVNDKRHGLYKQYHDNGQLRVFTRFENGLQVDGVVDSFDENGFLIRTVEIINGNLNGPFKEFYPSGMIKKGGEYKDDEIIGKPIEYYEDGSIKEEKISNIINKIVLSNKEFKREIDNHIKNEKVKNFELIISISKWYGHTPFKCSGEFEGHNFTSEIVEVCKWGICEHNYKDINKLLYDIKDYEIEEIHKYLDIDIISEDEDFEIEFIKWEEGTPHEFIEEIEEEWGAFDIRDNSTEEEQLDFIYKEGAVIDGIRILLSNDNSTYELSWIYSKQNEENDKVISALKHATEFSKDILDEAFTKISNAHIDNDKSYEYYENGQYQEGIESVKKALEVIPNRSNFLDTLAIGYYYLGDYKSAIEVSNNCIDFDIEKDSENAEHYTTRAKIYIKLNNDEKAIEDLIMALELDPDSEDAIQLLEDLIK